MYDQFLDWAKARGIKMADGVAITDFPDTGRGLGIGAYYPADLAHVSSPAVPIQLFLQWASSEQALS